MNPSWRSPLPRARRGSPGLEHKKKSVTDEYRRKYAQNADMLFSIHAVCATLGRARANRPPSAPRDNYLQESEAAQLLSCDDGDKRAKLRLLVGLSETLIRAAAVKISRMVKSGRPCAHPNPGEAVRQCSLAILR
jgi:hypothetical protein